MRTHGAASLSVPTSVVSTSSHCCRTARLSWQRMLTVIVRGARSRRMERVMWVSLATALEAISSASVSGPSVEGPDQARAKMGLPEVLSSIEPLVGCKRSRWSPRSGDHLRRRRTRSVVSSQRVDWPSMVVRAVDVVVEARVVQVSGSADTGAPCRSRCGGGPVCQPGCRRRNVAVGGGVGNSEPRGRSCRADTEVRPYERGRRSFIRDSGRRPRKRGRDRRDHGTVEGRVEGA